MNLSPGLISDFVKVTNDKQEKKETTIYATVVSDGDSLYAQFDGSELLTPIDSTIKVKDGDRVLVTVRNHAATIIGSTTSPAASNSDLEETSDKIGNLDLLLADKAEVGDLEAIIARIDRLIAEDVVIGGRLTATEGYIKQLEADNLIVNGKIVGAEAEIEFVKADKLSVKEADIKYANIDFANIDEAWVNKLFVKGSFLADDINAATGSFSKYLTGVNIVGDNITAGTIATDRLVIRDPDTNTGILFAINNGIVAQEGLSEEALKRMTLNGQVITAQSITADKINVTDLFAQYIEASDIHITGDSTFGKWEINDDYFGIINSDATLGTGSTGPLAGSVSSKIYSNYNPIVFNNGIPGGERRVIPLIQLDVGFKEYTGSGTTIIGMGTNGNFSTRIMHSAGGDIEIGSYVWIEPDLIVNAVSFKDLVSRVERIESSLGIS